MNRTSEKSAFPYWNSVHSAFLDFVAILAPQQQKKRKPKDSILPRWGEKNDRVCFPQKESFGKSKLVFLFKVGAKIDF